MFDNVDWGIVCFQMTLALISSGIVGALLSHHWNKKAAEKNKAFEKEISRLKAKLDSGTYVTNMQYEREFNLFVDFWGNLINLEDEYYEYITLILEKGYPESFMFGNYDVEKCLEKREKMKRLCDSFSREMCRYEPFFDTPIKKSLLKFPGIIISIIDCAEYYLKYIKYNKSIDDTFEKLSAKIDKSQIDFRNEKKNASEAIRNYLNSLKVK